MEKPTFRFKDPKAKRLPSYIDLSLFPIAIGSNRGTHNWNIYTGRLVGDSVHVDQTNDVTLLYAMGCFGKGNLSWSNPQYNTEPSEKSIPVMSRRRFLMHRKWAARNGSTNLRSDIESECEYNLPYKKKLRSASGINAASHVVSSAPNVAVKDAVNDEITTPDTQDPFRALSTVDSAPCLVIEPDPWLVSEQAESEAFWGIPDKCDDVWTSPRVESCSMTESGLLNTASVVPQNCDSNLCHVLIESDKQSFTSEQATGFHGNKCIAGNSVDQCLSHENMSQMSVEKTIDLSPDQDSTESSHSRDTRLIVGQRVDDAKSVCGDHGGRDSLACAVDAGSDVLVGDGQAVRAASDILDKDDGMECDDADVCVVDDTEDSDVDEKRPTWQTIYKRDPYSLSEHLVLSLEEAFFLSYGIGCLVVNDSDNRSMNLTQMWRTLCNINSDFPFRYAVYHNYRSKAWVPKSGLKFGVDFLLYKWGPAFYHATYSVVVKTVKASDFRDSSRSTKNIAASNWISLSCLNRVTEQVSKELMLCYVIVPDELVDTDLGCPTCIAKFKITEVVIRRWISKKERENSEHYLIP